MSGANFEEGEENSEINFKKRTKKRIIKKKRIQFFKTEESVVYPIGTSEVRSLSLAVTSRSSPCSGIGHPMILQETVILNRRLEIVVVV